MNLSEAISSMREFSSQENNRAFAELFRSMVDDNSQVYTTASRSGSGYAIDTVDHFGNFYCVMYSNSGEVQTREGSSMCTIGLSNLIDSVYANPHIAGLVINPHKNTVFLQRKDLQLVSGKADPRQSKRDWGVGIPAYNPNDIMVAEEAIDFAMEIVASKGLQPLNYTLIESNSGLTAFPNFVAEKDGKTYYIAVDVAVAPKIPKIREDIVPKLLEIAESGNAEVLYAPVSFGSADSERMQNGLVLIGDEYIGNFLGFIQIEKN